MKIVLMSDNHLMPGMESALLVEEADISIHLGDSQLRKNNSEMSRFTHTVRGNCDFEKYDKHKLIEIMGMKWLLLHGDALPNPYDNDDISEYAKRHGATVICFGHTHVPVYQNHNGVTIINPGSFGRSRATTPNSYMVVNIDDSGVKASLKDARNCQEIMVMYES